MTDLQDLLDQLKTELETSADMVEDYLRGEDRWTWEEVHRAILTVPESLGLRLTAAKWLEENAGTVPCGKCGGTGRVEASDDSKEPKVVHFRPAGLLPVKIPVLPSAVAKCPACREGRVPDANAARAEFVRVQLELAALEAAGEPECDCRPGGGGSVVDCSARKWAVRVEELRRRERELLDAHGFGWCDGLLGPDWKTDGYGKEQSRVGVSYYRGTRRTSTMWLGFGRGMIETWEGDAADFLAHEAALYWCPGLTDECPTCLGVGKLFDEDTPLSAPCHNRCDDGRVPRPRPQSACPLREVRLTTQPGPEYWTRGTFLATVADRWPGVTFRLPGG